MPKVEIKNDDGMRTKIFVDGIELKNAVRAEYSQSVGEVPQFTFETHGEPNISVEHAAVQFRYHPETVQQAATVLRDEFLKKSAWYDALVSSINSVLHESSSEYLTKELAKNIADRLIGE